MTMLKWFLFLVSSSYLVLAQQLQEVTTGDCGANMTCFKHPSTCTSSIDCKIIAKYKYESGKVHVIIATNVSPGYVGWAQSIQDMKMVGAKGVVCVNNGTMVDLRSFNSSGNGKPTLEDLSNGYILLKSYTTESSAVVCEFTRSVTVPSGSEDYMYNLTDPVYVLYASGSYSSGDIVFHSTYIMTDEKIGFTNMVDLRFPINCTTDCNAIVKYYREDPSTLKVEMSTKNKWVGFAFKPEDGKAGMINIRGQYCVEKNAGFGSFHGNDLTENTTPNTTSVQIPEITNYIQEDVDGMTKCSFERPIVPLASTPYMYSWDQNLIALIAAGDNLKGSGDKPGYHGNGNYLMVSPTKTTLKPPTTTPPAIGIIRVPSTCSSSADCKAIIRTKYDKQTETFKVEMSTKHKWVAFAQKPPDGKHAMVNMRGQFCISNNAGFGSFHGNDLLRIEAPAFATSQISVITDYVQESKDGVTICSFVRPVTLAGAERTYAYNLDQMLLGVIAFGDDVKGATPDYHKTGNNLVTKARSFLHGGEITGSSYGLSRKVKAHGILMVIAWVIFASCGITMARYMKEATKDKTIFNKQAWFPIHVFCMVSCLLLFVVGFILIFVEKDGWHKSAHSILGVITVILGLIQPIMATFRPDRDADTRPIFNWSHRSVGMGAWILACVTIIIAFRDFLDEDYTTMVVFMVVNICLFIVLDIILCTVAKKNQGADVSFDQTNVTIHGDQKKGVSIYKGSKVATVFFFVIMLFSIAMGIYHAYIISGK